MAGQPQGNRNPNDGNEVKYDKTVFIMIDDGSSNPSFIAISPQGVNEYVQPFGVTGIDDDLGRLDGFGNSGK